MQQAARCTYQELKRQALSAYYDFSRDEVEKNNPSHLRVLARLNHHFEGTLGCPIEELMFCVVELVLSGGLHVEVEQNCREWIKVWRVKNDFAKLIEKIPAEEAEFFMHDMKILGI